MCIQGLLLTLNYLDTMVILCVYFEYIKVLCKIYCDYITSLSKIFYYTC